MSGTADSDDMDYSDEEGDFEEYYQEGDNVDIEQVDLSKTDPEYFEFKCLSTEEDPTALLIDSRIEPRPEARNQQQLQQKSAPAHHLRSHGSPPPILPSCSVCVRDPPLSTDPSNFGRLACEHPFCKDCWAMHFEVQISQGISTGIRCMAQDCDVLATEDFVLTLVTRPGLRKKYQQFAFSDYVKSHPQLRFCPGPNCQVIVQAALPRAKRCTCISCKTSFCFRCGTDYHAPTDCATIKRWLTKCADDSETANYISAHTKDCPKCHICIEKNGGCNHMQCYSCKHDFCWMCLGDWKTHGSEYYECSRYKENPNIAHESAHAQAREALKKYLHYYERVLYYVTSWENHSKSLKLEEQKLQKITKCINKKVMAASSGTWIDWQYLMDAASLLAKCRYTLQYTYPYAYYLEAGSRKELVTSLEAEIENLAWKVERAETTDRGDLENQMDIAEKKRTTLLKDFLCFDQ
ncbi:hypothetical protein B566_EDAN009638 [Ephemera danica]|nr:hypothetical protein B566_EDAN009638 [Ephemera danica]